ncbi:MAG: Taurine import ATP-binding protein TauB [Firmicutes bacterium ADurb.Bin248]|nr:MAG: Taurine import ATP-binding protein TauB [Firmicutes bacterium ADurb.Bin248]HOG01876.1 ABC transporter ATP-binding protein [Clostridia bacterium]HPK16838.1 ABC transporter ATP-binding protein [Clostridia bacterium]
MEDIVVDINDVSLIYHERSGETPAVDHLSMQVKRGEFVSVVGPSGCGKTSVLSLIAGIIEPSSGSVSIDGFKPGYMLQRDHLLDWRNVEGNILLGLEVQKNLTPQTRNCALGLLDTYGLSAFAKHYPRQLSGGMRQKVALIRTLATSPDVLLLDEPFSSLDYQTRLRLSDEVYDIIKNEHKTAILVTHDISEAISMSDRLLVFTRRPARIKNEHKISLSRGDTPIARRKAPEFKDYFDVVWKELDVGEV